MIKLLSSHLLDFVECLYSEFFFRIDEAIRAPCTRNDKTIAIVFSLNTMLIEFLEKIPQCSCVLYPLSFINMF